MRINVEKIFKTEGMSSSYNFSLDFSDCEFWGEYPIKKPIDVTATVQNRAGMVILTTHADAVCETRCARCTKDVVSTVSVDTENYVVTETANQDEYEMILAENYEIDLKELLRSEILTAIPFKVLCRDDCKGLCPKCGKDLNEGPCSCADDDVDPRLAILKTLL